jgi:ferric-dicitrate binding protein FerR (iron transport regulator)
MQQEPLHIDWNKLVALLEKPAAEQPALVAALSTEEQALFAHMQELKEDELLTGALQLDTERAWKRTMTPVRTIRWQRWVAAACLLAAVATGGFFWLQTRMPQPGSGYQPVAQALAGHTPSAKVQLVTGVGHTIEIDSTGRLEEQDGTAIQLRRGEIAYNVSPGLAAQDNIGLINTLIVPRGYMYTLSLSDGSKVWLNADSKISYPVRFDKGERKVRIEGEAYFEVAHNARWPFTVTVGDAEVKVLGTSFDVKAYGKNIYTTLVTGSVLFTPPAANPVQLTPDHQTFFNGSSGATETRKIIAGDWIAWKDDDLVMIKTSLAELAEILERRYDVKVSFTDEKLKDIQYNGALHLTGSIIDMLNNLEQTVNIHFAVKDKKILILPANTK